MQTPAARNNANRRLYNGKELQVGTGYLDFKWRHYDSSIGRFLSVDKLTEDFHPLSPYQYASNRPIDGIDLDGLEYVHFSVLELNKNGSAGVLQYTGKTYTNAVSSFLGNQLGINIEPIKVITASFEGNSYMFNSMKELNSTNFEEITPKNHPTFENIQAIQEFAGNLAAVTASLTAGTPESPKSSGPQVRYNRREHYGNTPTRTDRKIIGAGTGEVVDHNPPLVRRYYEGDPAKGEKPGYQMSPEERRSSANDRSRMQRQDRSASDSQGGKESQYSRQKRKEHGL